MILATHLGVTKDTLPRKVRPGEGRGHAGETLGAGRTRSPASKLAAAAKRPPPRPATGTAPTPVFRVVHVADGDTFQVRPNWVWNGQSGDRVRIANDDAPERQIPGTAGATAALTHLIQGDLVELGTSKGLRMDGWCVVCSRMVSTWCPCSGATEPSSAGHFLNRASSSSMPGAERGLGSRRIGGVPHSAPLDRAV